MDSNTKRPTIPADLWQRLREAGAPLGMGPREYLIYLAERDLALPKGAS